MRRLASLFTALAAAGSGIALADTEEAPLADAPAPAFATIDRTDGTSRAGADIGFSLLDDVEVGDAQLYRIDLYGQYVTPQGIGGYAALPVSRVAGDGDSASAIGNLEVGGLYHLRGSVPVTFRGGLLLETADDDLESFIVNVYSGFGRLTDLPSSVPNVTWMRIAASPQLRRGELFARLDAGLDIPISAPEESDIDPIGRVNAGVGRQFGKTALMGELVTIFTTGDADGEDRFLHNAALSARFDLGKVQPSIAVVLPVDEQMRDILDFVVVAGVQAVGF